jgi:hypothetical protein
MLLLFFAFDVVLLRLFLSRRSMSTAVRSSAAKPKFVVAPTAKIFESFNTNPNWFRFTTAIAGLQLVLWSYLSYFAMTQLGSVQETKKEHEVAMPEPEEAGKESTRESVGNSEESSKSNKVWFKWFMTSKWRLSLSILSLTAGSVFALVAYIYPLRLVRSLTYIRPSQSLKMVTHTPWGTAKAIEVPLLDVVCHTTQSQVEQGHSIALRVQDYSLFFMLNHRGMELNPMLRTLILSRKKH